MDKIYISKDLFQHILICLDDPEKFDPPMFGSDIIIHCAYAHSDLGGDTVPLFTLLNPETHARKTFEVLVTDKSQMKEPDMEVNAFLLLIP